MFLDLFIRCLQLSVFSWARCLPIEGIGIRVCICNGCGIAHSLSLDGFYIKVTCKQGQSVLDVRGLRDENPDIGLQAAELWIHGNK